MNRLTVNLTLCLLLTGTAEADPGERPDEKHIPVVAGSNVVLTSSGTHLAQRETSGPDTFVLYGGPDHPTEGKFQLADGVTPDWGGGDGLPGGYGGGDGAWTPADLTDQAVYWHRSQFNAQTLGTSQPSPNHAMWSGVELGDPAGEGWSTLPGYGNGWNDVLLYESDPLVDPTTGETVTLEFYFHHDTEPGFDFFIVEYDSAGTWTSVYGEDGSDQDAGGVFHAPGVRFSDVQERAIVFTGDDYGGDEGDRIRIRMLVSSDGIWSDQDGLWITVAGAAQVDEITLVTSQGTFREDYEIVATPPDQFLFHPTKAPFAGDFVDVYGQLTDIDPCRTNNSPAIGMIDFGQIIRNGPGVDGTDRIVGGSTSPGINYGIVGNHVVNYNGGLSFGEVSVVNEVWSPDIFWDLPGTDDDDVDIAGALIRFDVWRDLPLFNGMFYLWHVRSAVVGETYDTWTDRNFVYYGGDPPVWMNHQEDVSNILQSGPERVQLALAVWDYASIFGFPGTSATPSPVFDNVAFHKYRLNGPVISLRNIDLAQDGFPISGSIAVSSSAERDALDVPFSIARDINTGDLVNTPGDSIRIHFYEALIPGTIVEEVRLVWALRTNPVFEDALRAAPSSIWDENVVAGPAGTVWRGEVIADTFRSSHSHGNTLIFDLPDEDFMYPGDVLHYYFESTDNEGRSTTLPTDTSGFLDFTPDTVFDRLWTVRALPSIQDSAGNQPSLLVINDFGHRGGESEWLRALGSAGYVEGVDFDTYTVVGPTSLVSNGIGSAGAHGANADQLSGYDHIIYLCGDLSAGLLSNGTDVGQNDKGDDVGVLEQWQSLLGTRNIAYFGDNIASGMVHDSAEALAYLTTSMNVAFGDEDVRDAIGGQTASLVVPDAAGPYSAIFSTEFVAYGGCLSVNQFDQIQPGSGAVAGHLFTDVSGVPIPANPDPAAGGVASVIHPRPNGFSATFPYAFHDIVTPQARSVRLASRDILMQELLGGLFNAPLGGLPVTGTPEVERIELAVQPNPFNSTALIRFTAPPGSKGSVKVFNLRGERVRTLHSGEFATQEFRWAGVDDRGAPVASGVYLIQATDGTTTATKKVALVK